MENIVLIGYGGHAKSVADAIERQQKFEIIGYTDLVEHTSKYRYLGTDAKLNELFKSGVKNVALGIGYMGKGDIREQIYGRVKRIGYNLPVIIDPSAIVADSAVIGEGVFIGKGAIVNAEAIVEKMAIINTNALVEHECHVGEFAHVAVGAVLCGQVDVGNAAFIGASSTIIQCRKVSSNTVVPAGATVR